MENPYISIVIISYNGEKYIDRCISSALKQDYDNYEVVFIDDGSTDNTLKKVQQYQDNRLKWYTKKNGGIISARKEGVKNSKGEYILFVDGDDYINSDMVTSFVKCLASDNSYKWDIVITDFYKQNTRGDIERTRNSKGYGRFLGDEYFRLIMEDDFKHFMFAKLYRRKFILDAGYLDYPNINMAEDLLTNSQLGVFKPNVLYCNASNYYYQYNDNSMSRAENPKILEQGSTLGYIDQFLKSHNALTKESTDLLQYQWFYYAVDYLYKNWSNSFKKDLINLCRPHLEEYKLNKYYIKHKSNYKRAQKIILDIYLHYSLFTPILSKLLFNVSKIKQSFNHD